VAPTDKWLLNPGMDSMVFYSCLSFSGEDICGMYLALYVSSCLLITGTKALKCTAQYYPENGKDYYKPIAIGGNVQLILSIIDSII
jgi:hypothetical protein